MNDFGPQTRSVIGLLLALAIPCVARGAQDPRSSPGDWVVEDVPLLSIGEVEGDPAYLFQFIVVARLLPDGNLLVGDRGNAELRIYDATGAFVTRFGGRGEGPSEFSYFEDVVLRGDTILIHDPMLGKLARFDMEGRLLGTQRPPRASATLVGIESDGTMWFTWLAGQGKGPAPRVLADSMMVGRYGPDGTLEAEFWGGNGLWRVEGRPHPFSPVARLALHRGAILRIGPVSPEVAWLDTSGTVRDVVRIPVAELETDRAWSILEDELRLRSADPLLARLEEAPRSMDLPSLAGLLVDDDDHVWVKEFDPREDAHWLGGWAGGEGGTWWIIDPNGVVLQSIQIPEGVSPLGISGASLVGRSVDALGVNRVVVHRIRGRS